MIPVIYIAAPCGWDVRDGVHGVTAFTHERDCDDHIKEHNEYCEIARKGDDLDKFIISLERPKQDQAFIRYQHEDGTALDVWRTHGLSNELNYMIAEEVHAKFGQLVSENFATYSGKRWEMKTLPREGEPMFSLNGGSHE